MSCSTVSRRKASNIGLNLFHLQTQGLSDIEKSIDKIACIENRLIPVVLLLVYSRDHKGSRSSFLLSSISLRQNSKQIHYCLLEGLNILHSQFESLFCISIFCPPPDFYAGQSLAKYLSGYLKKFLSVSLARFGLVLGID
ncbi:hypothetical protein BpHYR1_021302 [Brachionus plicatilis]|uniref:Uncharacterized protein n=1 Tax=Brachionus plicatilis TaxID=10195 RepID=A0A3M7SDZ8_BRAPC|nr:hypothetical protein BpHYR1_021302 [Brachionus plicatilis]